MTFEEAYSAAARLLEQRGQLMNGHLLRLVENDKAMFSEVRSALIRDDVAEDRSGVGLAFMSAVAVAASERQVDAEFAKSGETRQVTGDIGSGEPDWWVLVSGAIRGPFDFETLCRMHRDGEIAPGDVVRQGERGLWQRPSNVLRLSAVENQQIRQRGTSMPASNKSDDVSADLPVIPSTYFPPEKIWSSGKADRPSRLRQIWDVLAHWCGGSIRLSMGLASLAAIGLFLLWWKQPPGSETIYKEFTDCYSTLQKLRERRIGRSEWAPTVTRYRPRVQSILTRLQFRAVPVQKELYMAGTQGLMPLLDVPRDPTDAERIFEKHIRAARALLDNAESKSSTTGK